MWAGGKEREIDGFESWNGGIFKARALMVCRCRCRFCGFNVVSPDNGNEASSSVLTKKTNPSGYREWHHMVCWRKRGKWWNTLAAVEYRTAMEIETGRGRLG